MSENITDVDVDYEYELKQKDKKIEELEEEIEHLNELLGRDTKKKQTKDNDNKMPSYYSSSLFEAITADSLENVQYLVEHGSDLEARDSKQRTPLHLAVFIGDTKIVEYLSQNGSQFEVFDSEGFTPFLCAVKYDYVPIAQILYKYGARANNIKQDDNYTISPIVIAVMNNSYPMLHFLIDTCKCNINSPIYIYGNPILHYSIQNNFEEIALELIKKGANLEERDKNGFTPLHTSMKYYQNGKIYSALINKGANIDAKDNNMETPLMIAFVKLYRKRHENKYKPKEVDTKSISYLLSKGANPTSTIQNHGGDIRSDPVFKKLFGSLANLS